MKVSKKAQISPGVKILHENPCAITGALTVKRGFRIGAYSYLRSGIVARLSEIGRYCSIGPNVIIGETEHPLGWLSTSPFQYSATWRKKHFNMEPPKDRELPYQDPDRPSFPQLSPVSIENDVWIGANVLIRCGVKIGTGAVCAAGSIVTKDVPPYTIVAGVPAVPIRKRFPEAVIDKLLDLQWWQYDASDLMGLPFHDVDASVSGLREKIDKGLEPRPSIYITKTWAKR